jgi:hypothetical protein
MSKITRQNLRRYSSREYSPDIAPAVNPVQNSSRRVGYLRATVEDSNFCKAFLLQDFRNRGCAHCYQERLARHGHSATQSMLPFTPKLSHRAAQSCERYAESHGAGRLRDRVFAHSPLCRRIFDAAWDGHRDTLDILPTKQTDATPRTSTTMTTMGLCHESQCC